MPSKIREADIEAYLVKRVAEFGGRAEKYSSPQRSSVPDRLVLWTMGRVEFVECKAPGKKPTAAQERDHAWRRSMGYVVEVIDTFIGVDKYIGREY